MNIAELECVILTRDMPEKGLMAGDIGTVVQVYCGDEVEVVPNNSNGSWRPK